MLIFVVLLLVAAGLVILYSTSAYNGQVKFHDPFHYLKKQGFATLLGLFGMALIARVDYHKWVPLAIPAYVTSIILSVAVIFFGDEYNGSKRWLSLGPISFQPSEFAKVAVIFFLACLVSRNVQRMKRFRTMILMMIPVLPIVGLVGASNLSTAIIILGIGVILIFASSPHYLQFIALGGAGIGFIAIFLAAESYRLERLAIWRDPEKYEKMDEMVEILCELRKKKGMTPEKARKSSRRSRDFTQSEAAGFLDGDWVTVYKNWASYPKPRMI